MDLFLEKDVCILKSEKLLKCKLIPNLLNIVCTYLISDPNPSEALNLYLLNSKVYKYDKYLEDTLNYKINVFTNVSDFIIQNYTTISRTLIVSGYETIFKRKSAADCIYYVVQKFKEFNLDIPITLHKMQIEYPYNTKNKILIVTKINTIERITINQKILSKMEKQFYKLSFFWKLIYLIMYIDIYDTVPKVFEEF